MGKKDGRISIKRNFARNFILHKKLQLSLVLLILFGINLLHTSLFAQNPSLVLTFHSTLYSTYDNNMFLKKETPDFSLGFYSQYKVSKSLSFNVGPMLNFERFAEYDYYGKSDSGIDQSVNKYLMTHLQMAAKIRYKYLNWFYICGGLYTNKYLFSIKTETKNYYYKNCKGNIKKTDFLDDPEFGGIIGLERGVGKFDFGLLLYLPFDRTSKERNKNVDQLKVQLNYRL